LTGFTLQFVIPERRLDSTQVVADVTLPVWKHSRKKGLIMAKTAAAMHILVKEEAQALDLLEQLKNGGDFEKLAKKHSTCPSGKKGGHLGEFKQGAMVPAFDKVVFSAPLIEPQGPLHTQFGYHIIKILYRN
jgi:peptidyl-prolyl cis-trans isomerase C